jgi:hypothetical protein
MADDPQSTVAEDAAATPSHPLDDLSVEVGASLASVWARYAGARPTSAETELDGNVVRWRLADGNGALERGLEPNEEDSTRRPLTISGYKRELTAAVARTTGRRVMAAISKEDKDTGGASETFILERLHRPN